VNFQTNSRDVDCSGCCWMFGLSWQSWFDHDAEAAVSIGGTERKFCSSAAEANLKRSRGLFF
jgi:hypothetical protein